MVSKQFWLCCFVHSFMLKSLLNQIRVPKMSRDITSFFKPATPRGTKRKLEEVTEVDSSSSEDRLRIVSLSKTLPALSPNIGRSWFNALEAEFSKDYFKELSSFIASQRKQYTIYPPEKDVYSWTLHSNIKDIKVVILGQDPYHGPKQAHGLAFSVCKGVAIPPSLRNMYGELSKDISGFKAPSHGFLYGWASQGVLLLNTCLTVKAGCANSHRRKEWRKVKDGDKEGGWEQLTDAVIKWINENLSNVVFMLWGNDAQSKAKLIAKKHLVLTTTHPSPLSAHRGFTGCRHFSKANSYLENNGKKSIDWCYLP